MSSKQQQTMSEHGVREIKTRSVPTYVHMPLPPDPYQVRWAPMPLEPVGVHWDPPLAPLSNVSSERMLQRMDQDLQMLSDDVNRLWGHSTQSRPKDRVWNQGYANHDRYLTQPSNEAEFHRLWSRVGAGSRNMGLPIPIDMPRGYFRPSSQPLVPVVDTPWGADADAEVWRKRENFHIENPVVKGKDGQRQFRLEFDLRQFNPEEIDVLTDGHLLTVQAKHEEMNEGKSARREYFRQCTIPQDVDVGRINSQINTAGILTVHAPVNAIEEGVKHISIKSV